MTLIGNCILRYLAGGKPRDLKAIANTCRCRAEDAAVELTGFQARELVSRVGRGYVLTPMGLAVANRLKPCVATETRGDNGELVPC